MPELTEEQKAARKEELKKQRLDNLAKARANRKKIKPSGSPEKTSSPKKEEEDDSWTII